MIPSAALPLFACAWSLLALAGRALIDPKRLRASGAARSDRRLTLRPIVKRLLWTLVLAPGLLLIALGAWPALLIWLGATTAIGWGLAHTLAPPPRR